MLKLVLTTLVLAHSTLADVGTCALTDPKRAALLERIQPLNGKQFTVAGLDASSSYDIKLCMDVSSQHPNASVISKNSKAQTFVLGLHNETDIVIEEKLTVITFAGGDVIGSSRCNGTRWSTVIIVECSTGDDVIHLMDPMNAACAAFFHLSTPATCVVPKQSRWTVFFMLIFTAAVCYLVIGMAYRRFVTGAKGMEQIPNYDFWKDPCGYTRARTTYNEV